MTAGISRRELREKKLFVPLARAQAAREKNPRSRGKNPTSGSLKSMVAKRKNVQRENSAGPEAHVFSMSSEGRGIPDLSPRRFACVVRIAIPTHGPLGRLPIRLV